MVNPVGSTSSRRSSSSSEEEDGYEDEKPLSSGSFAMSQQSDNLSDEEAEAELSDIGEDTTDNDNDNDDDDDNDDVEEEGSSAPSANAVHNPMNRTSSSESDDGDGLD